MKDFFAKILKFLSGSVFNFIFKILATIILTEYVGLLSWVSYMITVALIASYSFYYYGRIAFEDKKLTYKKLILYLTVFASLATIDIWFLRYLVNTLGINYIISVVLASAFMFFSKFFIFNRYIFVDNPKLE